MSGDVLMVVQQAGGVPDASIARVLTAAAALGPVDVLVAGAAAAELAATVASFAGVRTVMTAAAPHLDAGLAEDCAPLVAGLMAEYRYCVIAASTSGKNIAPRVAAVLDAPQVSDITAVLSPSRFSRPIYAGNAIETVEVDGWPVVLTVRATAFAPAAASGEAAPIKAVDVPPANALAELVSEQASVSKRPDLAAARVVVSGGRGMESAAKFKMLERLADKLGAAIGASRAAVDAGFAPNDYQVGQTGRVVAPELYIAVGISGAIQHLAGMKDAKIIVAINKDGEAPIFQVADYGLVGDLFEILPAMEAALDAQAS